jgi:ribonuclease P protein component
MNSNEAADSQSLSFSKARRVLKPVEFDRIFAGKQFLADHCLVITYLVRAPSASRENLPTGKSVPARLGLSIGRKVGNAVQRNRWKRRIREAFRQLQYELPDGLDLVIRPRLGAECDFHQIKASLRGLVKKIRRKL